MQTIFALVTLFALVTPGAVASNPLGEVISLLDELHAKVTADGEREAKAYTEYTAWCDDVSANTRFAIKTAESEKANLEAKIAELSANIEAGSSKIEELAGAIAQDTQELNDATTVRNKEAKEFAANEAELTDAIDTISRAVNVLQREMQKNPAALAQIDTTNMQTVLKSLGAVIEAAAFNSADKQALTALVQSQQNSDADADELDAGAPAAAVYQSHSTSIFDLLEDLKEKAEGELSALRKAETNTAHNFDMLKQSLTDQVNADTKDMNDEKAAKSAAEEGKANSEGELSVTVKELKGSQDKLAEANSNCMTVAADHQATVAAREAELKVIAEAKKILADTTSGAVEQSYSFAQVSGVRMRTSADLAGSEVVALIKKLAKQQHSAALSQLASRISAVVRYGSSNGDDVFAKVKALINDLISKLESEAGASATEKAYCDDEMSKTEEKKGELSDDIAKLTSKIDQAAAKSASLKASVKELQGQLAALAKEQAEMDAIRNEQHSDFVTAKADLEQGLTGVRKALGVLRDYYGAAAAMVQQPAKPETFEKADGAASSIVGILEVCESDFATNLAKEESAEEDAQSSYDKMTQANKITKTEQDQSVKYKTKEFTGLDKAISDLSSDRVTANTELDAVLEYYSKLKERCIAKPETYEERKGRRTAEIAGLKEALTILEDQTAFVQRKRHGGVRSFLQA